MVVAAHHRVHLQANCLESGISSGPLRSTVSMGTFTIAHGTAEDATHAGTLRTFSAIYFTNSYALSEHTVNVVHL